LASSIALACRLLDVRTYDQSRQHNVDTATSDRPRYSKIDESLRTFKIIPFEPDTSQPNRKLAHYWCIARRSAVEQISHLRIHARRMLETALVNSYLSEKTGG